MTHPVSLILNNKGRQVYTVSPDQSVAAAINLMNDNNIGAVVVVDNGAVVGIFTERDVLRKTCFRSQDEMQSTHVSNMMTADITTGTPNTQIDKAMAIFTEKRCRHLPIIENNELAGLVSSGDVTKWIIEHQQDELEHLADYIAGEHTNLKPHEE